MKLRIISALLLMFMTAMLHADGSTQRTGTDSGFWVGNEAQQEGYSFDGGQMGVYDPLFSPPMVWIDPAAASQTAYMNLAIAASPANITVLMAGTSAYSLANGDYTDTITPRNVVLIASCTPAGATCSGYATITGKDMWNKTQTEVISFSTNTTVYGTGNRAWSSITSWVPVVTSTGNVAITSIAFQLGSGNKLGMSAVITSTSTEIVKVISAGAVVGKGSYPTMFNTTYNTYTPASVPNGTNDYTVYAIPKKR